ncbi:MAG: hypothetical protein TREMPRED_001231, partial [Tremellales sp. Tagirdzhanova-0007]
SPDSTPTTTGGGPTWRDRFSQAFEYVSDAVYQEPTKPDETTETQTTPPTGPTGPTSETIDAKIIPPTDESDKSLHFVDAFERREFDPSARLAAWYSGYQDGGMTRNRMKSHSRFWTRSDRPTATEPTVRSFSDETLKSAYDEGFENRAGFSAFSTAPAKSSAFTGWTGTGKKSTLFSFSRFQPKSRIVKSFFEGKTPTECNWETIDAYHKRRLSRGCASNLKYTSAELSSCPPDSKTARQSFKWSDLKKTRARAEEEFTRYNQNHSTFYTEGAIAAQVQDHNFYRYRKKLNDDIERSRKYDSFTADLEEKQYLRDLDKAIENSMRN